MLRTNLHSVKDLEKRTIWWRIWVVEKREVQHKKMIAACNNNVTTVVAACMVYIRLQLRDKRKWQEMVSAITSRHVCTLLRHSLRAKSACVKLARKGRRRGNIPMTSSHARNLYFLYLFRDVSGRWHEKTRKEWNYNSPMSDKLHTPENTGKQTGDKTASCWHWQGRWKFEWYGKESVRTKRTYKRIYQNIWAQKCYQQCKPSWLDCEGKLSRWIVWARFSSRW